MNKSYIYYDRNKECLDKFILIEKNNKKEEVDFLSSPCFISY